MNICLPTKVILSEVNHTTTTHSGGTGHGQVLHLEKHTHFRTQFDTLTIRKTQHHIIIQHCIHVFDPVSIHRTIKHAPFLIRGFTHGAFTHDLTGQTILPLLGELVGFPVEFPHGNGLWVHDIGVHQLELLVTGLLSLNEKFT